MKTPSIDVLRDFNVTEDLVPLTDGRGLCYRAGALVLRPSDGFAESQWISELLQKLPGSSDYTVPRPKHVANDPTRFVSDGWTALSFVVGESAPKRHFADILHVCHAFHTDVGKLNLSKPSFLSQRENRWHEADLVTWGEKELGMVQNVNTKLLAYFRSVLDPLERMMQPLSVHTEMQLIHGDMTGNVLFEENHIPSIIDITPYWRPSEYAAAIVVADGLVWHDQGRDLVELYGCDSFRLQLLVRALHWRCITFTINPDLDWVHQHVSIASHLEAVRIVSEMVEKGFQ